MTRRDLKPVAITLPQQGQALCAARALMGSARAGEDEVLGRGASHLIDRLRPIKRERGSGVGHFQPFGVRKENDLADMSST